MNTIEFNKKYTKLPNGIKTAALVAVEPVRLLSLTKNFVHADTEYPTREGHKHHILYTMFRNGVDMDLLCLILKSDTGAIFTTLRKDNEENREKYMIKYKETPFNYDVPRRLKRFNIIIKED